jgi:inner membrane protein
VPTVFTHAIAAAAVAYAAPVRHGPRSMLVLAVASAVVPDLDIVAFDLGIAYEHVFGHRGFTHSVPFAVLWATAVVSCWPGIPVNGRPGVWGVLATATLSHGLLDAMTNGGRGVGFWTPVVADRYFFPWRPLDVSPIGGGLLTARALDGSYRWVGVLMSELTWVWMPALALVAMVAWHRRRRWRYNRPHSSGRPVGGRG